jgi:beta-phosphoglucomutase family hydrolase
MVEVEAEARAVIWDMDGVIADTGPFHLMAWQKVFRERGVDFTPEAFTRHFGQRNDTIIPGALGRVVDRETIESISREKEAAFRAAIAGKIKPFPGVKALLRSLRESGFRLAIGSSAPIENIRLITDALGITGSFDAVVTGREVTEGKPNPQVFLLAAERLGVAPDRCIVIEDAPAGVQAAKRAGMYCVAVTNSHPEAELQPADLVVDTLEKVKVTDLERLISG